mgnify:CR=1 FL=1
MNRTLLSSTLLAAAVTGALAAPAFAQQAEPERSILEVADNLYRVQSGEWFGMALVTDEGILLADPLNLDSATWLKSELEERFDVPVEYIVYSHHHADHASGAQVWPDATVIAHEAAAAPLTPPEDAEALAQFEGQFGSESPFGGTRAPDETWSGTEHEITLGGETVKLIHVDAAHAADMAYVLFPEQRTLFVVDVINIKRLPFIGAGFSEAELDGLTDLAMAQQFDTVVPGHGDIGTPEDVERHRQYHRDVIAGVQQGLDEGKSLEEIQAELTLDEYAEWSAYERHGQNVAGAYAYLTAD